MYKYQNIRQRVTYTVGLPNTGHIRTSHFVRLSEVQQLLVQFFICVPILEGQGPLLEVPL